MRGTILTSICLLLVCVALGTTAQVTLKVGLNDYGKINSLSRLFGAFLRWRIVVGFGLYGISSLLYITIISRVDVSFAYPFIALTYIGVAIMARLHPQLRESIPPLQVVGLTLIFIGVSLIGIAKNQQAHTAASPQTVSAAAQR